MKIIKLAFQLVKEQKLRNLLIIIGISLGAIIITSSQIFISSIEESNEASIKELYGEMDLYVGHQLGVADDTTDPVSEDDYRSIENLEKVEGITPVSYPYLGFEVEYDMFDYIYVGFKDEPLAYQTTMVEIGDQRLPGPGEVIVSTAYAKANNITEGDSISLPFPPKEHQNLKVVGFSKEREYLNRLFLFNYDWLENVTRKGPNMLMIRLDSYRSKQAVGEQINMINSELKIDFLKEADEQRDNIGGLYPILTALNIAILIVSGLLLTSILHISLQNRQQQYAVMRIIGASKKTIVFLNLTESLILGSIGLVLGILIGIFIPSLLLKNSISIADIEVVSISIPWSSITLYSVIYIMLILTASTLPAIKAANLSPIEAYQNTSKSHAIYKIKGFYFATLLTASVFISILSFIVNNTVMHIIAILALMTMLLLLVHYFLHYGLILSLKSLRLFGNNHFLKITPFNALRQMNKNKQVAIIIIVSMSISIIGFSTLDSMRKTTFDQLFSLNPTDYKLTEVSYGNERLESDGFSPELYNSLSKLDSVADHSLFFTKPLMYMTTNLPNPEAGMYSVEQSKSLQTLTGITSTDISRLLQTSGFLEGKENITDLEDDEVIITSSTSTTLGYSVGDTIELLDEETNGVYSLRVGMLIEDTHMLGDEVYTILMTSEQMKDHFGVINHSELLIDSSQGHVLEESTIKNMIDDLGLGNEVTIYNRYDAVDDFHEQFNQRLIILFLAVGLMIGLSMIGLMNNSVSSIKERLPELSILRAIGLSKKLQTYSLILEGALLSTICGFVSVTISFWITIHLNFAFNGEILTLPILLSLILLLLSPSIGIIAFLAPAIWASKKSILAHIK
ncbi:putative ABC transport system permease protein [Alkalihalobacillus xiaoxiensis]|uniref:ABC transport system permease protein n=1 Tax=Shouchella xiaoxiensis TaxID=766895 RepID=A0ABS2SWH5_9BACI|nr:FtsX-like permease family protein [Shouchella xiaoxiensis]MBM7839351.1 putative ABC transport system permease protein [Shouchella xiaoxiensis]